MVISRDGAVVRVLASHQCGGVDAIIFFFFMWAEFVVGSCPCFEGFSRGTPIFLPPQRPTFPKLMTIRPGNSGLKSHAVAGPLKFPLILIYLLFIVTCCYTVH